MSQLPPTSRPDPADAVNQPKSLALTPRRLATVIGGIVAGLLLVAAIGRVLDSESNDEVLDSELNHEAASQEEPANQEELANQIGCLDPCFIYSAATIEHPDYGEGLLVLLSGVTIPESGAVAFITDGIVHWSRELIGFPAGFGIEVDTLGRAFFTASPGSARSDLIVLAPTPGGFDDFGSLDGRFSSYGGGYARDLLGDDGIYEIVVMSNDCTPSCGNGTMTESLHRWDGGDYTIVD